MHQVWYWSSEGVKTYWMDNTVGWEKCWFDFDLWTCDLKINRDHLLIEGNPCTNLSIDPVKGSKDIARTTLGLKTERPTYRATDSCKTICPLFQGGHKHIAIVKVPGCPKHGELTLHVYTSFYMFIIMNFTRSVLQTQMHDANSKVAFRCTVSSH